MSRTWIILALVLTGSALEARAGIVLSSSAAAPTTDIFASYDPGSDSNALTWRWTGNGSDRFGPERMEIGQSFLVPTGPGVLLDRITVRVREYGASVAGANYTLEVWSFTDASDTIGDTLVSSQSGILPTSALLGAPQYWTFDLDDVSLTGGQYYGFILAFDDGPDSGRTVSLVQDFINGYGQGRSVGRSGNPPSSPINFGHDLTFYAQGVPPSAVIPEPASALLAGLGLTGLAGRLWWRRRAQPSP